ncbi:MAG: acetyl-CoA C-acetyltransferase [Parvicella sp.]|jgi:acetyl-CoA C-acetyltransferase
MAEAVIVDAVRTPIARGKPVIGDLNGFHAAELLALPIREVVERSGLSFADIEYLAGGCVTQAGEQSSNVTRTAWLSMNEGYHPGATTLDNQCGSAQTANHMLSSMISTGSFDVGIACGVESMSRVPMGSNVYNGPGTYQPENWPWDTIPNQFVHAERIAHKRGLTREMLDAFGCESQRRAKQAWDEGRFDREVMSVQAPVIGEDGKPTGELKTVTRDQGLRDTTLDGMSALKPILEGGGIHTAATCSQLSDGAAAVLWMTAEEAIKRGLKPRARIITDCVVGADPYYLLDGPVDATRRMFKRSGMTKADIDLFEVNEAFAGVVLSWAQEFDIDLDKVNVNGGAIALGHPVGSTGARLICTALHELERTDKNTALIAMCCGSAIGTGTIIERL